MPRVTRAAVDDTATLLARAGSGDRAAIAGVFRDAYPPACRVARALAGEAAAADRVLDAVFRNALRVLPQWSGWVDPQNWFVHQAVLAARRVAAGRPPSGDDLLVTALPPADRTPANLAFARGIRRLPPQQVEAFLLHHGERLNARLLGVSMDCSTSAAETHLRAAEAAMRALAGDDWDRLTAALRQAFRNLSPAADDADRFVRLHVGAWAGRRLRRRAGRVVLFLILAVAGFLAWQSRERIRQMVSPAARQTP